MHSVGDIFVVCETLRTEMLQKLLAHRLEKFFPVQVIEATDKVFELLASSTAIDYFPEACMVRECESVDPVGDGASFPLSIASLAARTR